MSTNTFFTLRSARALASLYGISFVVAKASAVAVVTTLLYSRSTPVLCVDTTASRKEALELAAQSGTPGHTQHTTPGEGGGTVVGGDPTTNACADLYKPHETHHCC
eukprot:TRINITY_DN6913_c0_g1_i1.p1 TRINITY_DN6913_c0_g1~~TRINITY_DN6913_c0_g1_i1.p1  ORF type:complete len:106 (+),score=24.30 TRINITY_DN6913_c0_g1_i1:218-535(+)